VSVHAVAEYDSAAGAFISKQGALRHDEVELALRLAKRGGHDAASWRDRALSSLRWADGLYDSVGGGFVHSLRDLNPTIPVFDKWTADNAALLELRLDAYWLTGDSGHLRTAHRVTDYMERVLTDPRGGFFLGQVGSRETYPAPTARGARAYLRYFRATGKPPWRVFALRSLDRVWASAWDSTYGFVRAADVGRPTAGLLEDAVAMGSALLEAYQLAGRPRDLARARVLGRFVLERCQDPDRGGFFGTAEVPRRKGLRLLRRTREPDANAAAARWLTALGRATRDAAYTAAARRALAAFAPRAAEKGNAAAAWALALDEFLAAPPQRPAPPKEPPPAERKPQPRSRRYR
jgi:uncharacterized protein YyaL (SSP411 family)